MSKIWGCKIGEVDSILGGSDMPMREAVADAYRKVTGVNPLFLFSGWGEELTEGERACHENRSPDPLKCEQPRPSISAKRMWAIARVYAGDDDIATMDDVFDALSAAMAEAGVTVEEQQ